MVERAEVGLARSPRVVPDGIIAHRTMLRHRGGAVAVVVSLLLALVGLALVALPGPLTGVIGFLLLVAALPVLPIVGVPAVSAASSYVLATVASCALWFAVGHLSSRRATRRAIASWPEWFREYRPLAIGIWIGALLALGVSAIVLGAL